MFALYPCIWHDELLLNPPLTIPRRLLLYAARKQNGAKTNFNDIPIVIPPTERLTQISTHHYPLVFLSFFRLSTPQFNFVGKLLGPKGNSLKRLQEETMCKMAVLGKGSMRDRKKVCIPLPPADASCRLWLSVLSLFSFLCFSCFPFSNYKIHVIYFLPSLRQNRKRNCDSAATHGTHICPKNYTLKFPPTRPRPKRTPALPTPWPRFADSWCR